MFNWFCRKRRNRKNDHGRAPGQISRGKRKTPVLAVDADSNSNLNEVMGLEVHGTLGDAREEMKKDVSIGMTKDIFMEMKVQEAVIESTGFDLVVMGRPEGAGCYCAANTLLTAVWKN